MHHSIYTIPYEPGVADLPSGELQSRRDSTLFETAFAFLPNASQDKRFPLVRSLDGRLDPSVLFHALREMPGRVWLDSATAGGAGDRAKGPYGLIPNLPLDRTALRGPQPPVDEAVRALSRYSFLAADPIYRLEAYPQQADPWPELSRLASQLPTDFDDRLPPFQGGIIGIAGYEAARWLEPDELATCHARQTDDLPTPAMSFAVYDWTLAMDHHRQRCWLICQGILPADLLPGAVTSTPADRLRCATDRQQQILDCIAASQAHTQVSFAVDSVVPATESGQIIHPPATPELGPFAETGLSTDAISQHSGTGAVVATITSNFTSQQFRDAVQQIVDRIHHGDSFQVNLAQRLKTGFNQDPAALYLKLREINPAPFAGYYDGGSFQVLSSSPEGFLQIRRSHIQTRPIKGTIPRTGDETIDTALAQELTDSEKDRAENTMIVDLMRNDLSRVCRDESVVVSRMCEVERYQFVQHLVSVVEGDLIAGIGAVETLMACFPGGSVTGAPKIEAMKTIAELEPHPRGPYCGSMGYLSCGGNADFNILIRTITATAGQLQIPVGGGITARSIPASEEAETWAKAKGMLDALIDFSSRGLPEQSIS